ncbi:hypothetical protein DE146DRAFT_681874 [Phaeosphaeria sp. MPI-PUGE-AT-0046c]|nr:hypothetical protein DE146DRAFT_681874 [Phaeosphaeria sp. MPI-PUGE-AT-0046c]
MDVPFIDALAAYATPPNNHIGTTLFLSYIVLALYATFTITYSLYAQYNIIYHSASPSKDAAITAAKIARARHIKIYAFLASVSFATLSYHMLFFLITHYQRWSGESSLATISGDKLVRWMLHASLFKDFANELVENASNATWTQLAILATWSWNVWMARKARIRNFDAATMRNFILLSQILPISFTAALFLIQCHLASPDLQTTSPKEEAKPQRKTPMATLHLPNMLLNASLLALPSLRAHPIFSGLVLFERLILLLPHTGLLKLRASDMDKCLIASAGFIVAGQWQARKAGMKIGSEFKALSHGGYAVKALGWDAVLGAAVWASSHVLGTNFTPTPFIPVANHPLTSIFPVTSKSNSSITLLTAFTTKNLPRFCPGQLLLCPPKPIQY